NSEMSFWPLFAIISSSIIDLIGITINIFVLICLYHMKTDANWRIQVFVSNTFALIMYGPVLLLPKWAQDAFVVLGSAHIYLMWQLVPAQSILQFCSLFRSDYSVAKRVLFAYAFVLLLIASSFHSCLQYIPTVGYEELREIGRTAHSLSDSDSFEVYGLPLFFTGSDEGRSMLRTIAFEICPSYVASYLVFFFCSYRVYRMVHNLQEGVHISPRSKNMHSRLLRLQFAQGSIPLFCGGVIITISLICVFFGLNIGEWAVLLSLGLYSSSSIQGTLCLIYLRRTYRSRASKVSRVPSTSSARSHHR
ncbi:hypothetical protein PFISCL1PPCAC_20751, partial [Pristionchus fissidentatus]